MFIAHDVALLQMFIQTSIRNEKGIQFFGKYGAYKLVINST